MRIIGITGGSGAGKSTVTATWKRLGAVIVDADEVYREVLDSRYELRAEIIERFGDVIQEGVLDRKRLAGIVFTDEQALEDLNEITHKYVVEAVRDRLREEAENGSAICVIDAIYLLETDIGPLCDRTVAVTCPIEWRIARIMERDGLDEAQTWLRVKNQQSDEYYLENCELLLENTGDRKALEHDAEAMFRQFTAGEAAEAEEAAD